MGSRIELHDTLTKAFASLGEWFWPDTLSEEWTDKDLYNEIYNERVIYQPPATFAIDYPCVLYHQTGGDTNHANNNPYHFKKRYMILVIDRNPDSRIPGAIGKISGCQLDRVYTADNLYHWAFNLYY